MFAKCYAEENEDEEEQKEEKKCVLRSCFSFLFFFFPPFLISLPGNCDRSRAIRERRLSTRAPLIGQVALRESRRATAALHCTRAHVQIFKFRYTAIFEFYDVFEARELRYYSSRKLNDWRH